MCKRSVCLTVMWFFSSISCPVTVSNFFVPNLPFCCLNSGNHFSLLSLTHFLSLDDPVLAQRLQGPHLPTMSVCVVSEHSHVKCGIYQLVVKLCGFKVSTRTHSITVAAFWTSSCPIGRNASPTIMIEKAVWSSTETMADDLHNGLEEQAGTQI